MKDPFLLAGAHIVSTNVPRCRRCAFVHARSHNDEVLVYGSGRSSGDEQVRYIASQSIVQVDLSLLAKAAYCFAVVGIDAIQEGSCCVKNALVIFTIAPVTYPARIVHDKKTAFIAFKRIKRIEHP